MKKSPACVVADENIDEAELLRSCRAHLNGWKIPRRIFLVPEIPVNERGKTSRRQLAELFSFLKMRTKPGAAASSPAVVMAMAARRRARLIRKPLRGNKFIDQRDHQLARVWLPLFCPPMPTKTVAFTEEAAFVRLPAGETSTSNHQIPGRNVMEASKKNDGRVLVLEPDDHLAETIAQALSEAAPTADIESARSLEEAQRMAMKGKPDLFVLDVDATYDLGQDFLYDLRTSHPNSRAIILTATHLSTVRERAAGIGAIHFLEKPFPHNDFVDLVQALLRPSATSQEAEKFQGTLSDLHMADIIQLKCMSGTTAAIEFTSPRDEKGRIYFENGQVRHATAPGKEGIDAFNEIVQWKGGRISEVAATAPANTISQDWQLLLMEGMRQMDEATTRIPTPRARPASPGKSL